MSQHPDFAQAVAKPIDLHEAVHQYRALSTRIRTVTAAGHTSRADKLNADRTKITLALTLAGHSELVEALIEESRQLARLMPVRQKINNLLAAR